MAAGLPRFPPQAVMSAGSGVSFARVEAIAQRQDRHTQPERSHAVYDRREERDAQTDEYSAGSFPAQRSEPLQNRVLGKGPGGALRNGPVGLLVALQRGCQAGVVPVAEFFCLAAASGEH